MIRKLLVVAAAIAMPVSVVSVVAVSGGVAGAAPLNISCTLTANVTFASPGLNSLGTVTTATTESTKTTGEKVAGGGTCGSGGTAPNNTIKTATIKCPSALIPNPACVAPKRGYGSYASYVALGTGSIKNSLKTLTVTISGTKYTATTVGTKGTAGTLTCTSPTYGAEGGFYITGTLTSPAAHAGEIMTEDACLGKVTGTGLVGNPGFPPSFLPSLGTATLIKTSVLDVKTSTLHIA